MGESSNFYCCDGGACVTLTFMSKEMLGVRSIAQLLQDFTDNLLTQKNDDIAVRDVVSAFHERGFGVVLLFFALPMALPVPVPPVLNVILALPLLFLTAQQALGRHLIWLPDFILRKSFSRQALIGLLARVVPFLRKMEALTRPRLVVLTGRGGQVLTGLFGFVMALSVTVPLPLTNTVPSFGIAVMALGVLMRDGVAVFLGGLIGMAWVTILTVSLVVFGLEGLDIVKDFIKSLLSG